MGALAQSGKMYRVGLVSVGAPDTGILGAGLIRDFAKRGYAADRNIVFEHRAAEGRSDRLPGVVDQLVADRVDLIITQSYPAAVAAKEFSSAVTDLFRPNRHTLSCGTRAARLLPIALGGV